MIIKITYRIIYNRAKRFDRNGKASVVIEAYQNPNRRYFSTGLKLTPGEWDKRKNEVKGRPELNRLIRSRITELETFETRFPTLYNRPFALQDFDLMKLKDKAEKIPTFSGFANEQIDKDRIAINYITHQRYKRTIKLLVGFGQQPAIEFSTLTYNFIEGFDFYLRTVEKLASNTIYKHHQVIQKYLAIATKKGYFNIKDNPYNDFRPKKAKVESAVLLPAEIEKIEQLNFTKETEHLAFYRDAFLIAYYTLLRIGDVTRIRQSNLIETDKGLVLEMKAQKTGKLNRLPLFDLHCTPNNLSKPEQIIKRYWRTDNQPLFARSHPKLNEYVKDVIRLAGISKDVTFHTARHSGITYLSTVLPTPVVQQLAQHSSIATTMGYVHISGQQVTQSLNQVKWF
ncbi:tyrosine-type recombinase/integrase [Larkinella bovis]|uniref:Tyrosine-type recombinase/integrase n=1 Tax=Larkinella bovis TaxID=683041 RepID=A0ABW0IEN1_9BACT